MKIGDKVECPLGIGRIKSKDGERYSVILPNRYVEFFDEEELTNKEEYVKMKSFTKMDLTPGKHVVKTQDCTFYLVIEKDSEHRVLVTQNNESIPLESYDNNLLNLSWIGDSIIAVYEIASGELIKDIFCEDNLIEIWNRSKRIMTLKEVENILGYKVEIV